MKLKLIEDELCDYNTKSKELDRDPSPLPKKAPPYVFESIIESPKSNSGSGNGGNGNRLVESKN